MNNEQLTSEVARSLQDGQIAFIVGAGISAERQSWIPLWKDMVYSLLEIIAGEEGKAEVRYVEPFMDLLFNEVILHQMTQIIGPNKTADSIKSCMDTKHYSAIHKFFAWAIEEFKTPVLTTNYDDLIEEAAGWRYDNGTNESKNLVIKLHGTLSKMEKARFTINQVFAPLEGNVRERAMNMLNDRIVVVAGYQGLDEFDVIPVLFDESHPRTIIWLVPSEIDPIIREKLEDRHYNYFKANVDEFLHKVYEKAKQGKSQLELDNWWIQRRDNQKEGWWKIELKRWGDELWQRQKDDVRFLWAKILDYLRVYRIYQDRNDCKPAEEAYNRFLSDTSNRIRNLEARMRMAYVRRTCGIDSLKESYNVIAEIKGLLEETKDKNEQGELQMLLGRALHECGTALQNARDHLKAKAVLDEAMKLRALINDPQISYSLFQEFMNAVQYARNPGCPLDRIAPVRWRSRLIRELEKYSNQFKVANQPGDYGQTLHNMAFVHQFLADEFKKFKKNNDAEKRFRHSLEIYYKAMRIREQLRDQRMIAQSKVRVAQCNLGLAWISCENGNSEKARVLIDAVKKLAGGVDGIYKLIPQEKFRRADVEQILEEANRLKRYLNSMEMGP